MTTTNETVTFTIEIKASITATDGNHALILLALDLLASALDPEDEVTHPFDTDALGGLIADANISISPEEG